MQTEGSKNYHKRLTLLDTTNGVNLYMTTVLIYYGKELDKNLVFDKVYEIKSTGRGALSPEYAQGGINDTLKLVRKEFINKYEEFKEFINEAKIKVYFKAVTTIGGEEFEKNNKNRNYGDYYSGTTRMAYRTLREEIKMYEAKMQELKEQNVI